MRKDLIAAAVLMFVGAGCAPAAPTVSPVTKEDVVTEDAAVPASDRLDLSGQGMTSLPSSALERTGLRELDISDNRLGGALPSEIGRLSALEILDASDNVMTGVPAEIGHLPELRVLDLSDNMLTGLPHELGGLKKLVTLDLRGNDVSASDVDIIKKGIPQADILVDNE